MTRTASNQLDGYDPQQHLLMLKTPNGSKAYYPFIWRLYEFRLRYPSGILDAQIIEMDLERDFVIVKVTASEDGLDTCKGVGLQAGSLVLLNQITDRAKVQALADLGIGCPWPVIFEDDAVNVEIMPIDDVNTQVHEQAAMAGQRPIASHEHKPACTAETVQAFYAKVYQMKPQELEAKWAKFCLGVTGRPLSKGPLTEDELGKLNGVISQAWQRKQSAKGNTAA